jgi:hypothetical protein
MKSTPGLKHRLGRHSTKKSMLFDQYRVGATASRSDCCTNSGGASPDDNDIMFVFRIDGKHGHTIVY